MGIYLSTPKTDKLSEDGENEKLRYGLSSMQGWRTSMEDAHAAYPDLDCSTSFFGVYDGHGGQAVSKFCAKYLHQQVIKHEAYSSGDIGTAVQKSFLRSSCLQNLAIFVPEVWHFVAIFENDKILKPRGLGCGKTYLWMKAAKVAKPQEQK